MSQWKLYANASTNTSGPIQWMAYGYEQGSGNPNQQANNVSFANGTSTVPVTHPQFSGNGTNQVNETWTVQQLAFTPAAYANATANTTANATYTGEGRKIPGGTGWVVRKAYEGPVTGLTAANGSAFANGETALLSNGSVNAVAVLVANATGNLTSASIGSVGLFPNTADIIVTFNSERHLANVQIGANTVAFTNLPAANTPVTVTVSNTGNSFALSGNAGLIAVGTFVSNIASGITNTLLNTITWGGANTPPFANATGFWGLFSNNQTNSAVVITFSNANGQVIANGTPATLTAELVTHAGTPNLTVTTLGGRAGRVQYETLVSTRFIANSGLATGAYVNVATLTVTGNTGSLASVNALANVDYLTVYSVNTAQTVVAAYATIVTDANGSLQNTGITLAVANGFNGGQLISGVPNTHLVVAVYSKTGALLNFANLGSVMPASSPGASLTFGGTIGTVSANSAAFLPQ